MFSKVKLILYKITHISLLKDILTTVSGSAGAQLINLALMPVIMRIYGPEAFGVLGTFQSLIIILIPIAALTYPMAIMLPHDDKNSRCLIKISLISGFFVSLLFAIAIYFFGKSVATSLGISEVANYLFFLPFIMFSAALLEIIQQWLYRNQRFLLTARIAAIHAFSFNAFRAIAGFFQSSASVLVFTSALYYFIYSVLLLLGVNYSKKSEISGELHYIKKLKREEITSVALSYKDFPLYRAPQMLINAMSHHAPTLILAAKFGTLHAGFFTLCMQILVAPTNFIGKAVASVYYPKVSRSINEHKPIVELLLKATGILALLGLLPFGLIMLFGSIIFSFAFGDQWAIAGQFAGWLAIGEYVGFFAGPCASAAPALGRQRIFFIFEIISVALRFGSVLWAISYYHDAMYVVIAYSMANVLINFSLIFLVLFKAANLYRNSINNKKHPSVNDFTN